MAEHPDEGTRLRIVVARSGGFAGLRRQWQVELGDEADDWIPLVEACPWERVRDDPASRDRFVWRIEAHQRWRTRTASVPDRDLTGPWRDLVDRVRTSSEDGIQEDVGG